MMVLDAYVKENYTRLSDGQIATIFNTDLEKIKWIRRKNGLQKRPGIRPTTQLTEIEYDQIEYKLICEEMNQLIRFCEMTSNTSLKSIAMTRLKTLSGIPINNPFADRIVG